MVHAYEHSIVVLHYYFLYGIKVDKGSGVVISNTTSEQ